MKPHLRDISPEEVSATACCLGANWRTPTASFFCARRGFFDIQASNRVGPHNKRDTLVSEAEFFDIYRPTVESLYSYLSHRSGGDRELAEDIVQETYLKAVSDWRRQGRPQEPMAWLNTVARNLLVSHYRRIRPQSLDGDPIVLTAESMQAKTSEQIALIQWGLSRLSRQQANLLEAFHFDGKQTREIACNMGISERAVEGRLRRARVALGKMLRPFLESEGI